MRRYFVILFIFILAVNQASAVIFSPNDIEWASAVSGTLHKGGVDLNTILRRVAPEHGGTGGGHPFAGGARIPDKNLKAFLFDLDDALG